MTTAPNRQDENAAVHDADVDERLLPDIKQCIAAVDESLRGERP